MFLIISMVKGSIYQMMERLAQIGTGAPAISRKNWHSMIS